jgi:hypothetical protein
VEWRAGSPASLLGVAPLFVSSGVRACSPIHTHKSWLNCDAQYCLRVSVGHVSTHAHENKCDRERDEHKLVCACVSLSAEDKSVASPTHAPYASALSGTNSALLSTHCAHKRWQQVGDKGADKGADYRYTQTQVRDKWTDRLQAGPPRPSLGLRSGQDAARSAQIMISRPFAYTRRVSFPSLRLVRSACGRRVGGREVGEVVARRCSRRPPPLPVFSVPR